MKSSLGTGKHTPSFSNLKPKLIDIKKQEEKDMIIDVKIDLQNI